MLLAPGWPPLAVGGRWCHLIQNLTDAVNSWRGSWDHRVGTVEGFATPQSLELVLALEGGKAESHLPGLPRA